MQTAEMLATHMFLSTAVRVLLELTYACIHLC
jgi:hypothetical protein